MAQSRASQDEKRWTDEELRRNIGQLFIVGFNGHVPNEDIKTLITKYHVGTIILFQRNIKSASQLLELTASLQDIAKSAGHEHPLFIATDQENGLVTRLEDPIAAQLPGPMALAATGDSSNAYNAALATAEILQGFGINMNYAPIADVNSEPKNPVIGVRSPSDDPEVVARFVSAQVKGLQAGGIIPCVKHFPGHGDTAVDSHFGLPVISKTKNSLEDCEMVPFRRAVVDGVDAVMTAHIVLPGLNGIEKANNLPASLNPDAIKILREELKFDGLIVSDCIEMDGVRTTYGTEKAALMALKAGSDSIMICHTYSSQVASIEQIFASVKLGEVSQIAVEASVNRIKLLKGKYLLSKEYKLSTQLEEMEAKRIKHSRLAEDVYAKSTTLVRSSPGALPISGDSSSKIVFLAPGIIPLGGAVDSGEEISDYPYKPSKHADLMKEYNASVKDIEFHDGVALSVESDKLINDADFVILATGNASLSSYQKQFGLSLGEKLGKKLVVMAICDPYDFLEEQDDVQNYLVIYEPSIPAFKSALEVIFGSRTAQGHLPVGIHPSMSGIHPFDFVKDVKAVFELWVNIFPTWPIQYDRLATILNKGGHHFIHQHGFCLSYFDPKTGDARISCIGVRESHRGKGLGTALISRARAELRSTAQTAGFASPRRLTIDSSFPRFWPGPPLDLIPDYKDFFVHRGFHRSTDPTARDLYRDITREVAPPAILARVESLPLEFRPWSKELYEECITKQYANFSHNQPWVKAYEHLAATNQYHEVMVALDGTGAQVGWTLMASPASSFSNDFAFLECLPSKDQTGVIACVGVDRAARGKGIGLALLIKAMENMRERGVRGVLIDWVVIRGFYENLGFKPVWEYEKYVW